MSVMDSRNIIDASGLSEDATFEADVAIVGTGAGGGFTAEVLTRAGLKVMMIEAGAYHTAKTFSQNEAFATPMLYQDCGAQRSKDGAILILQGRSVGGGTTVNWTTCLTTPEHTLATWRGQYGLSDFDTAMLTPFFEEAYNRLNVHRWEEAEPNGNNGRLARGCAKLGYHWDLVPRNVNACANSGLCGLGCPINAKQSQMVTTIPWALDHGAGLIVKARATRLIHDGDKVSAVEAAALQPNLTDETGRRITVRARHFVLSAGAIRTPGLLIASGAPDPSGMTGKRTFLHPTSPVTGTYGEPVEGFHGAPQSVYSDQFLAPQPDRMGFKLETIPVMPVTLASFFDKRIGAAHAERMRKLANIACFDGLMGDGFHEGEACGTVHVTDRGPLLDYPVNEFLIRSNRFTMQTLAEIHFAAGAQQVSPWHIDAPDFTSLSAFREWAANADLGPLKALYGSAHVMGGARMGGSSRQGVVDTNGRHFALENLSVHDASIFPTGVGVNPQMTIYATAIRNAHKLAGDLV